MPTASPFLACVSTGWNAASASAEARRHAAGPPARERDHGRFTGWLSLDTKDPQLSQWIVVTSAVVARVPPWLSMRCRSMVTRRFRTLWHTGQIPTFDPEVATSRSIPLPIQFR